MEDDLAGALAEHVASGRTAALPPEAVEAAVQLVSDCAAVTVAGSVEDASAIVRRVVAAEGALPRCTVLGQRLRTSPANAALANGVAAHALDFDDGQQPSGAHPSAVLVPALLAVAEDRHLDGAETVAGYLSGLEVMTALGALVYPDHYAAGWHATATIGTVGAAAAVARLAGLPAPAVRHALGIAASHSHGLRRNFGAMAKPLHAGTAARDGLMAALLAEQGFTAGDGLLDGPRGWLEVFVPGGRSVPVAEAMAPLDGTFAASLRGLHIKRFPSCGITHTAIGAALAVRAEERLDPGDVASVTCLVHRRAPETLLTRLPASGLEGKFSLEYCVARALLSGDVALPDFTDERVLEPAAVALASRVAVEVDPSLGEPATWETTLRVTTAGGATFERASGPAVGKWSGTRLTADELQAKQVACMEAGGLAPGRAVAAADGLAALASCADVADLCALLGAAA